jgi:hypothetical protein
MKGPLARILVSALAALALRSADGRPDTDDRDRIDLTLDTGEADAVLSILAEKGSGRTVPDASWQGLFTSVPYLRLKKREASLHVGFTDDDFRKFVLSPELAARAADLRATLEVWRKADLAAAARRVLAYLPTEARIKASVYPVIKPGINSFVFEASSDPAIFLYLDPTETSAKFENTVAHELHHIGYASVHRQSETETVPPPPGVGTALEWMGCFGEGFAMLAAAGSPDVHPHAVSSEKERSRWDHDMGNFNADLKRLEKFFIDVIDGRLKGEDQVEKEGMSFFGLQGPWYTVGYGMAIVIEKHDGRPTLIECMADPRRLLSTYNRDAKEFNAGNEQAPLALWSPGLLAKIGAP